MAEQTSFSEIFGTVNNLNFADKLKNNLFYIPDYQRNYDWSEQQIERLFIDYVDAAQDRSAIHYVGSILYNLEEIDGKSRMVVIDGQQRTTSVLLMYLAIFLLGFKAAFKKKPKSRYNFLSKFDIGFLGELMNDDRVRDLIRYDYDKENERFLIAVTPVCELLKQFVANFNSEDDEAEGEIPKFSLEIEAFIEKLRNPHNKDKLNRFQHNFLLLYELFEDECTIINEQGEAELDIEKLQSLSVNKVKVEGVFVEIKNQDYAITVFNAINTTGVKLSDGELIRAYLICHNTVYAKDLDYIEQDIKEYCSSSGASDKLNPQKIYSDFFATLIYACRLRTGVSRYRSWFKETPEAKEKKAKNKNYEFKIYTDFKLAYDKLQLRENPLAFAELIKRYYGYYKFLSGFDSYKKNEFFQSLPLNSQDKEKFLLIVRGFKDLPSLSQYMAIFLVLMERIDSRLRVNPDSIKLEPLNCQTCLRVMHLLWSFVVRVRFGSFYGDNKLGNTSINIVTLSQDKIFDELLNQLNTETHSRKFNDETLELFTKGLLSNKKFQTRNPREFAYLLRIVHQNLEVCDVESNLSANSLEHIMPQTLTPEWKVSNLETTFDNWEQIKEHMTMPAKPACKEDLSSELMTKLEERFKNCLGNFLLLSQGKNSAASNKMFRDKIEVYKNDGYQFFVNQLRQKPSWGYADIIELTKTYGKYIFGYCSIDNPDFKDLDK